MTTTELDSTLETRPIEELLADLDFWTGRTKIELVDEAIDRWGEIVPHLLVHLEKVIADPDGYLDEDHDLLPDDIEQLVTLCEAVDSGSEAFPRTISKNDKKAKVQRKKKKRMAKASRRKNR
jgi:hypothetical protein